MIVRHAKEFRGSEGYRGGRLRKRDKRCETSPFLARCKKVLASRMERVVNDILFDLVRIAFPRSPDRRSLTKTPLKGKCAVVTSDDLQAKGEVDANTESDRQFHLLSYQSVACVASVLDFAARRRLDLFIRSQAKEANPIIKSGIAAISKTVFIRSYKKGVRDSDGQMHVSNFSCG